MRFRSAVLIFLAIMGFGPEARAVLTDHCVTQSLEQLMLDVRSLDTPNLKPYAGAQWILALSDGSIFGNQVIYGESPFQNLTLAGAIAKAHPGAKVVSGDVIHNPARPPRIKGNLITRHLDNTKPIPYENNRFDVIVMKAGMCIHEPPKVCGGFQAVGEEADRFFREVARVLNKGNPGAKAILQGSYGVTAEVVEAWKGYLAAVERDFGVDATLQFDSNRQFVLVTMTPRR